ncbi:uncharacterized protein BX664DRAFT_284558, partial [Halteromyces radiatus]|uniref:uncharacterized protein n=1 Tax=Halteromyces radiatus TaxID=101107 RepID=UPI00221E8309
MKTTSTPTFSVTTSIDHCIPTIYDGSNNTSVNPKKSHLYKTEYCRNWSELGVCRYGKKCRYAHGDEELRMVPKHNRYKTQICRAYHLEGTCLYGSRCTFIHLDEDEGNQTRRNS